MVFDKLIQVLRFGCYYEAIAESTCSATTIRDRSDEWIALGVFAQLARIALESYDRIVGLLLDETAVDGCTTKTVHLDARCSATSAAGGCAGTKLRSPPD